MESLLCTRIRMGSVAMGAGRLSKWPNCGEVFSPTEEQFVRGSSTCQENGYGGYPLYRRGGIAYERGMVPFAKVPYREARRPHGWWVPGGGQHVVERVIVPHATLGKRRGGP